MKNLFFIVLALFAIFNLSKAQPTQPCDPCPSVESTTFSEREYSLPDPSTCKIKVVYEKKHCPNGCFLKLDYLSQSSGDCSGFTVEQLIDYANTQILIDSYMGDCQPGRPGDQVVVKIYISSCYRWEGKLGTDGGVHPTLVECSKGSCCMQMYWVEMDPINFQLHVYGGILNTVKPCIPDGTTPPVPGCMVICNP